MDGALGPGGEWVKGKSNGNRGSLGFARDGRVWLGRLVVREGGNNFFVKVLDRDLVL
jgi:hypothetical protein